MEFHLEGHFMKLAIALLTIALACILSACSDQRTPDDIERAKGDSDSMSGIGNQ